MAGLSLAEQIAQLDDTAPADIDIERLDSGLPDEDRDVDLSAGRGHYLDVGVSSMRKQRDALVDPKYEGARTSRSQLYEFDGGSDNDRFDDEVSGSDSGSGDDAPEDEDEDEEVLAEEESTLSSEDGSSAVEDEESGTKLAPEHSEEAVTSDLTETLKKNREADKTKGQAVMRQRTLWDSLVETRIRMQKAATATSRLPAPDRLPPYVTSDAGQEAAQALLRETLAFSEDLFRLRKRLLAANEPNVIIPPAKRQKLDTDDNWEEQTRDATVSAAKLDEAYHPSSVRTLQKWSSKIAAVTPALSSRSKSFRGGGAPRSVVELVEDALGESGTNGSGKAVVRTRIRRSGGPRIGATTDGVEGEGGDIVEDPELFDDLDFYQALLRDVIDSRTGSEGAGDWSTRQRLKKAKKIVDTKASKGRKLRYEVHEKLQNIMVPVQTGNWHEEQIDELFANLLGRGVGGDVAALA